MKKILGTLAGLLLSIQVQADPATSGEAIAAAINNRDVDGVLATIDVDAVSKLVLKDLALKDADRDALRKGLPKGLRNNLGIGMKSIEASNGSAKYVRSGTRGAKRYVLVRMDLGDQGTDYVEYFLTPAGKVEDWYVHSMATLYSTSARLSLATLFKTESMLYGLFGSRIASSADVKPFTDLRLNLQAQDYAAAYRTLERFPDDFRKTRQWALMRVTYAARMNDETHRAALRHLAANFPTDPELQFIFIDHHLFEEQFDRALGSVTALEEAIGGEDGATANLRGTILASAKRFEPAAAACRRGMALEPDHKPAYWCLVNVGLATKSGKIAIEGLKAYERAFSIEFNLDKLAALEPYHAVARTPEFAAWKKSRR